MNDFCSFVSLLLLLLFVEVVKIQEIKWLISHKGQAGPMYTHAHTVYLVCISITDIFPAGALSNLSQIMMLLVRNI